MKQTLIIILFPSLLFAQGKDSVAERFSKNISQENLSRDLHVLASDEYEGRETGKRGQKMAAEYIAKAFKDAGIPPYKENTYYQEFPLNMIMPLPADITVNGKKHAGNKDFYNYPGLSEQTINVSNVLFLGYGIEEESYNDYANMDAKNKVIMVMAGEPYNKEGKSVISGETKPSLWTSYYKTKPEKAREKGAAALLIVVENVEKDVMDHKHRLETPSLKLKGGKQTDMPIIYISAAMANEILKKQSIEKQKQQILASGKPQSKEYKTNLIIAVKNTVENISSENVLGYVEGSDLKEELIVITAHYDHLGVEGKIVYNGADDDGSGTVSVMELARVFAKAKKEGKGPRRSMLFMTVAGEEKGLLGSAYYTENPVYPLEKTVCDLNIDMIGRLDDRHPDKPDYIYLIGSDKLSTDLHKISENANKIYTQLDLDYIYNDEKDKNRFYYRSDHYNFAKKGIPVIFYFNGTHADYHKETDEVQKIDFKKMHKITQLVFFTAWDLANRTERIKVDANKK